MVREFPGVHFFCFLPQGDICDGKVLLKSSESLFLTKEHYRGWLKLEEEVHLYFIGHADVTYYEDYNEKLSKRRSKRVADYVTNILKDYPKFRGVSDGTGERYSRKSRSLWSKDRRVDIYDLNWDQRGKRIKDLSKRIQKAAEQGFRRHEESIRNRKVQIEKYRERLKNDPKHYAWYLENILMSDYHSRRLKESQERLEKLKKAILKGNDAFKKWFFTPSPDEIQIYKKRLKQAELRLEQAIEKLEQSPPEQKEIWNEIVDSFKTDISDIKEDLRFSERNKKWAEEKLKRQQKERVAQE